MTHLSGDPKDGLTKGQWNTLATICTVLLIEISVGMRLLLRQITGQTWEVTSLALAFIVVFAVHQPLERWIWGTGIKDLDAAPTCTDRKRSE